MSTFIKFDPFGISLGSSISQMRDIIKNAFVTPGWRCPRGSHTGAMILAILGDVTTPANAFDMDYSGSTSSTTSTLPKWVGVQTAGPVAVTRFSVQVYTTPNGGLKTFSLDYSDDGVAWTTHQTWTNIPAWVSYENRQFVCAVAPGAHSFWRIHVTAVQVGTALQISDLKMWASDGSWIAPFEYCDFLPPIGETIGDSASEEFIRFRFTGPAIAIEAKQRLKVGLPQVMAIQEKTAGAVAGSVTINGVTVTQSVTNAAWTAKQNLRQLYYDLQGSTDPNFTAWTYEYQQSPPQSADDTNDYIYMVNKTVTDAVGVTVNANVNLLLLSSPQFPGTIETPYGYGVDLTVDLISGWFCFLQLNSRAFQIASKTNSNVFGPIFGWYRPHSDALAYSSVGPFSTLSEAFVGWHDVETPTLAAASFTYVRPSHFYFIHNRTSNVASPAVNYSTSIIGGLMRGKIMDGTFRSAAATSSDAFTCRASGIIQGLSTINTGNDSQVHTAVLTDPGSFTGNFASFTAPSWVPAGILDSIYKFIGTSTNEVTQLIQDSQTSTTLSNPIAYSDVMAGAGIVTVGSTADFPSAGYFVIGDEAFHYTGKTIGTFTGVTRAKYATIAANHYAADQVYLGQWFVKINGGALLAGNVRPT